MAVVGESWWSLYGSCGCVMVAVVGVSWWWSFRDSCWCVMVVVLWWLSVWQLWVCDGGCVMVVAVW